MTVKPLPTDHAEAAVYRITIYLCSFTLSVSLAAGLLLPASIIGREVLRLLPNVYYVKWINGKLIRGQFSPQPPSPQPPALSTQAGAGRVLGARGWESQPLAPSPICLISTLSAEVNCFTSLLRPCIVTICSLCHYVTCNYTCSYVTIQYVFM